MESNKSHCAESSGSSPPTGSSNSQQPCKPQNFQAGKVRAGKRTCLYNCGLYIKEEEMQYHCNNVCSRRNEIDAFEAEFKTLFMQVHPLYDTLSWKVEIRHPNGIPAEAAYRRKKEILEVLKADHMIRRGKFTTHWLRK